MAWTAASAGKTTGSPSGRRSRVGGGAGRCQRGARTHQQARGAVEAPEDGRSRRISVDFAAGVGEVTATVAGIGSAPGSIEATGGTRTTRRCQGWPQLVEGWPVTSARRSSCGGFAGGARFGEISPPFAWSGRKEGAGRRMEFAWCCVVQIKKREGRLTRGRWSWARWWWRTRASRHVRARWKTTRGGLRTDSSRWVGSGLREKERDGPEGEEDGGPPG
jgi:hypothetical protein